MRENIFTQFARAINNFQDGKITKKDLFHIFTEKIVMCDNSDREEAVKYLDDLRDYNQSLGQPHIDIPTPPENIKKSFEQLL